MSEVEKIIVLRTPVVLGDRTYAELVLREPTAGELSKASAYGAGNTIAEGISLISQIAEIPLVVVSKLGRRDFTEANNFLADYDPDGQTTGEMSSQS